MSETEVLVIGAGPAGCTAACVLAQHGHEVLLLEKDTFPRYKVGESLIPYCFFPLQRIGMIDRMRDSAFTKKYSVQFAGRSGRVSDPFYFEDHQDHPCSQTWQVERGQFDSLMLEHARDQGVIIQTGLTVSKFLVEDGVFVGVKARDKMGKEREFRAKITIDATGRDNLAQTKMGWRVRDKVLKKMAIWTYFKGAKRDSGRDEGATTVAYIPSKGWFWYIPLQDDRVSVGVVADKDYLYRETRDPEQVFMTEVANNGWIQEHLKGAERVEEFKITGDYSYRSKYCAADGLVLAGDAFAFLDPVFSSGVFLALYSGEKCGDAVHEALVADDVRAERFEAYGRRFCEGIEAMRRLVYVFYDTNFSFKKVLEKHPHLRQDLTDCLIGNVDRDFETLFEAIAQFAPVPPPLEHGRPLARETKVG